MDILTLEYIFFIALALILALTIFALNSSCKDTEKLNERLIEHVKNLHQTINELTEENRKLKANLLYERTKDDASNI